MSDLDIITSEWFVSVLPSALSAIFSLVGVVIGALLTKRANTNDFRRRELLDSYSRFIAISVSFASNRSDTDIQKLISSGKRLQLLCNSRSCDQINQLLNLALQLAFDSNLYGKVLQSLEQSAQKDIKSQH